MKNTSVLAIIIVGLLWVCGCGSSQQGDAAPMRNQKAVELGQQVGALVADGKHEIAVIQLREGLAGFNEADCGAGFVASGGSADEWTLVLEAARDKEFETGAQYGKRLQAESVLDADVVEYVKSTLRNAPRSRQLAFASGFVSVFEEMGRALHHFHTLWMWAMPGG